MYRLEDRALSPKIRPRNQSQPTYKRTAEIAQNVPIQIPCSQQNVILERIHHQLHARVVHNVLGVFHLRKSLGNLPATTQKTNHPTAS